jgi:hypothetical protein
VLALTASPSPAEAAVRDVFYEAGGKADGYRYQLSANAGRGGGVSLTIGDAVRAETGRWQFETFYTPAARKGISVGRKQIKSGFGQRGGVGLRFKSKRKKVRRFGPCARLTVRRGVLRGHLRFRGEGRYIEILDHRLRARQIEFRFRRRCARASDHERAFPVALVSCRDDDSVFVAFSGRSGRSAFLASSPFRRHRGVVSTSVLTNEGGAENFGYNADRTVASVRPPFPFQGVGAFAGDDLTGDLRFTLPSTKREQIAPAPATIFEGNEEFHCPNDRAGGPTPASRFVAMARAGLLSSG